MAIIRVAIFFLFLATCSGEVLHKVIGGDSAKKGSIPYIVSVQEKGQHKCGGSILDELHILTAAHCVTTISHQTNPGELMIQYGNTDLATERPKRIQVDNIKYHEYYNPNIMFHDIAILTLAKKIIWSKDVQPIELPGPDSVENMNVVLAGWGKTRDLGVASNKLQVVDIIVYSDEECEEIYENFSYETNRLYQICAGISKGGKGQCSGDSGGPLVIKGTRIQVGIVSWSRKQDNRCAGRGSPGVFVKLANYINWINDNRLIPHIEL